jgi:hypothetical protein
LEKTVEECFRERVPLVGQAPAFSGQDPFPGLDNLSLNSR